MPITTLPVAIPALPGKPRLDGVPELQDLARRIAAEDAWSPELARVVTGLFDEQATTWDTEHSVGRFDPINDALHRGGLRPGGICLEIGSGTGQITPLLAAHFDHVVAADLSHAMLAHAPRTPGHRICCDASRLPMRDGVFNATVLVDTFCFPRELGRIVDAAGAVIWINLLGEDGPLYVPTADIAASLPGTWTTVDSQAGWGTWAVLKRSTV
jgi:SAM-dependent methyltransferase